MKLELALSRLAVAEYRRETGTATAEDCATSEATVEAFRSQIAHLYAEQPFLI